MENSRLRKRQINHFFRALIETGFIIFLFYSNLLMGEFTKTGNAKGKSILWAVNDIFTETNFEIALAAAILGYIVFEFLRKKL